MDKREGARKRLSRALAILVVAVLCGADRTDAADAATWKAGVAAVDITPDTPIVLLGYGDRKGPFESVAQPIYAKALALEDSEGRRAVLVTADLVGFQAAVTTNAVSERIEAAFGLTREQLIFNASHSHTGPLVSVDPIPEANPVAHAPLTKNDIANTVAYAHTLRDKLVAVVGEALNALQPAQLAWGEGHVPFPMNRRLPKDGRLVMADNPDGDVDRRVPVLSVASPEGDRIVAVFGCACHCTALTGADNVIAGDYAGFAQARLEAAYPEMQAMFMSGCGGDANPSPRGSMDLAKQHGETLANEVARVLEGALAPVNGPLKTRYEVVPLPLKRLSRDEIEARTKLPSAEAVMARHMLKVLDSGETLPSEYEAPLAVWHFGSALTLVALPAEPVAAYATRLHETLPAENLWVAGYNNDCFGYLPTAKVVNEGGHENIGITLWLWGENLRRHAGFFAPEVEKVVIGAVQRLMARR